MNIAPLRDPRRPEAETPEWVAPLTARSPMAGPLARLTKGGEMMAIGDATAPHVIFPDGNGLVWATIFDRMTSGRIVENLDVRLSTDPIERLVEGQWGGYLAIRRTGRAVEIFRDPSGAISCYHARVYQGYTAATVGIGLVVRTDDGTIPLDWVAEAIPELDVLPCARRSGRCNER